VVEEACEVMEPTLMSVLSVRSLQKLELVGDHRQLPAFVQVSESSLFISNFTLLCCLAIEYRHIFVQLEDLPIIFAAELLVQPRDDASIDKGFAF
jgi:hypothetical protein